MRKVETVATTIFIEEVTFIKCDFCGVAFNTSPRISPITSFTIEPGYGSVFDLQSFDFEICDDCLKNLIDRTERSSIDN